MSSIFGLWRSTRVDREIALSSKFTIVPKKCVHQLSFLSVRLKSMSQFNKLPLARERESDWQQPEVEKQLSHFNSFFDV